jgi:aspartyl-tRNA(Asn)/glutamyl-tRNA(Gln) amidotransferase subunit A
MTIVDFGRRLRSGELTVERALHACLDRIAAENAVLNAFILVTADAALEQARMLDRELASGTDRGPLHGVPMSLKDIVDLRGTPTTAASRVLDGHAAGRDAPSVARLRDAGAVFVGKTNLHEFALGTTNEESAFGPARNPRDHARSPGGSSGGSAASVAAGLAFASIGTDTGGSIRIPAAACGTVGLKPTFGEVSVEGVVPLSRTLDHVGPLAQTVADAAIVYRALIAVPQAPPIEARPVKGLRLGVLRRYFCDLLDEGVRAAFEGALDRLRTAGAVLADVEIAHASEIAPAYVPIVLTDAAEFHAAMLEKCPEKYTEPVRQRLEMGRKVPPTDYAAALAARERLWLDVNAALTGCDALVLPSLPIPAPLIGTTEVRIGSDNVPIRNLMLRLTQLFDLTGHPAVSIPCGRTADGLPVGFQIAGARMKTEGLLAIAMGCERALRL